MTDKERLEEIEKRLSVPFFKLGRMNGKTQLLNDLQWLIEQAERVQELEKRLKIYQKRSWFEDYEKVAKQNKRYREALEFYADRDNYKLEHFDPNIDDYMSTVDYDEGQKARQTIESEANEIANKVLEGGAKE